MKSLVEFFDDDIEVEELCEKSGHYTTIWNKMEWEQRNSLHFGIIRSIKEKI